MQEVQRNNTMSHSITKEKGNLVMLVRLKVYIDSKAILFVDALLTITGHFSVSEGLENASESQVSPACCRKTFRQYKTYDKMNRISSSVAVVLLNKQ